MNKEYSFRQINKEELFDMFEIISQRVKWMDEVGINQWNKTDYLTVYPFEYYEKAYQRGDVFVLEEIESHIIVCAGILKKEDDRWSSDDKKAYYVHHLASRIGYKNVGSLYLEAAEKYAYQQGMELLRLDSAVDNSKLTDYYEDRGYMPVGFCIDGAYKGILREKKLR